MIKMGHQSTDAGIEQLDFLVAALCWSGVFLEGYDIVIIGYAVPSIADA